MKKKNKVSKEALKEPSSYTIELTQSDLQTLINFLSLTSQVYERLTLDAMANKNDKDFPILEARWKIANAFAHKFASFYGVGEPKSRDLH